MGKTLLQHWGLHAAAQEAAEDLKKVLQEKTKDDEKEKDLPALKDRSKRARRSAEMESKSSRALGSTEKKVNRSGESSAEPVQSDWDASEDEHGGPSSDMEDEDLFKGVFAIKDKERGETTLPVDRFTGLPSRIKKELQNFEPQVLQSIPETLSECLVYILLRTQILWHF